MNTYVRGTCCDLISQISQKHPDQEENVIMGEILVMIAFFPVRDEMLYHFAFSAG